MSTTKNTIDMAREAFGEDFQFMPDESIKAFEALVRADEQALAAPVQEPLGFMNAGHVHDMQQGRLPYGYVYPKGGAGSSVAVYTTPPATPVQELVAFLANGTRFKISCDSRQSGGQIHGIPPELGGRWVAFVAAEDDCHLKLTTPPNVATPLAAQRQSAPDPKDRRSAWVGLTDEQKLSLEIQGGKSDVMLAELVEGWLKEKNSD